MAASLLRRARATVVTSLAVRASPYSALRLPQHRLLTDRAEVEVAHCYVGARYSSSSAMSGFKETSLSSMSIFSVSQSKGLSKQTEEDPFDSITERPMRVAEGAGYSLVILAGLAVAGVAAYAVLKELIFEPKEYKIFGKALNRVQNDHQVMVRLGSPITGYGQESRNRAARQRISNRTYVDEDGVERIELASALSRGFINACTICSVIADVLHSRTPRSRKSLQRNVQGQGRQQLEVYVLDSRHNCSQSYPNYARVVHASDASASLSLTSMLGIVLNEHRKLL